MTARIRAAAKLVFVLQLPFAFACSDSGPGGPGDSLDARFAGVLTQAGTDAASGEAFRGSAAMAGARIELLSGGQAVAALTTTGSGAFSTTLPAGAYTVRIPVEGGAPFEFSLVLPAGAALFAQARVDQTPAGDGSLNVQLFHDEDGDGEPDDAFRHQILDRGQGDASSGVEDVVTSEGEAAESVTLCHVPPGNPDAAHTVTVGASAVPAHLAHGDAEGECVNEGDGDDDGAEEGEDGEEENGEDGETKVLVCHVPPGNPEHPVTIEVGESAVPAHLAHGDTEGACEGDTVPGEDGEGDGEEDTEGDGETKVLVCHMPPGNPENPVTIEVGESAVPAHLAHGDTEGECEAETPEEDQADEGGEEGD